MKDDSRARDQQVAGPQSVYPERITLPPGVERYLEQLGIDLVTGDVGLEQLPPSLLQLYTFAYQQGRLSLRAALEQAEADADRYYAEMCRRPPALNPTADPGWKPYAQLERERRTRRQQRSTTPPCPNGGEETEGMTP